jgi:hypothetical protein
VSGAKGVKFGQATIAVVDDVGNPVAGALVSDEFTGDLVDSVVEVQADGNGISLVQTSQSIRKLRNLQFCVTAITAPGGSLTDYRGPNASQACGSL